MARLVLRILPFTGRKDHGVINFSTLTKMTLTMLKRDTSTKVGVKSKRLKAGWDNDYLLKVPGL